jgi:hypothetical protein
MLLQVLLLEVLLLEWTLRTVLTKKMLLKTTTMTTKTTMTSFPRLPSATHKRPENPTGEWRPRREHRESESWLCNAACNTPPTQKVQSKRKYEVKSHYTITYF